MENNYLNNNNTSSSNEYVRSPSYFLEDNINKVGIDYLLLPEEYDIFSEIDGSLLTKKDTPQYELISSCLSYMRESLLEFYHFNNIICVIPKLNESHGSDGTITFYWAYTGFRASLSFEGEQSKYDAYCSIVYQTDENTVSTKTSKINRINYKNVMREILQLVVDQS